MGITDPSKLFDKLYYTHNCGRPYERDDEWITFFRKIADRAVTDFSPKSVLDAGCAKGFLVEGFHSAGVEAWGRDISEYAIQNVHPSIKDYCAVGSIADPLPQKYDLIISIEVIEHMPLEESIRAIENLCKHTDNILISSSPYDFKEVTHINVHPPDFWVRQFARFGFYHDLDYDASYITPWAMRFYRQEGSVQSVVQMYERHVWQMKTEIQELRNAVFELHERIRITDEVQNSPNWRYAHMLNALRMRIAPPFSLRAKILRRLFGWIKPGM